MSELTRQAVRHAEKRVFQTIAPTVDAARKNELITRQRVEALEQWAHRFSTMSRWEKLKWLIHSLPKDRKPLAAPELDGRIAVNGQNHGDR